ncbi:MAG: response regulator transcription factor [Gemmatimonadales bacterium]|nr:response regulator transcription factor [Gemmatimonadales bacterium]
MIKVLIADDHAMVRKSLQRILGDCPDLEVVCEVTTGHDVLPKVSEGGIDVLLLDISMPGPRFLDLLAQLTSAAGAPRVLVLSAHTEDQFAISAIRAGAAGFLTKDRSTEELCGAIRAIHDGRQYVRRNLEERLGLEADG